MHASLTSDHADGSMADAVRKYLAARLEFRTDGRSGNIRRFAEATEHLSAVFFGETNCREEILAVGFDGLRKALADAQDNKQRLSH